MIFFKLSGCKPLIFANRNQSNVQVPPASAAVLENGKAAKIMTRLVSVHEPQHSPINNQNQWIILTAKYLFVSFCRLGEASLTSNLKLVLSLGLGKLLLALDAIVILIMLSLSQIYLLSMHIQI